MENDQQRDYAEEAANRALMHEEPPDPPMDAFYRLARAWARAFQPARDRYQGWRHWRRLLHDDSIPGMVARNMMAQDLGGAADGDQAVLRWAEGGDW